MDKKNFLIQFQSALENAQEMPQSALENAQETDLTPSEILRVGIPFLGTPQGSLLLSTLSSLLPNWDPQKTLESLWDPLLLPLLSAPQAYPRDTGLRASQLLLQLLSASESSSIPTYLLKKLKSETENQDLKQAIEDALLEYAIKSMRSFCAAVNSLMLQAPHRLSLMVLLTRLLKREDVPVYILLESNLLNTLLESCWVRIL